MDVYDVIELLYNLFSDKIHRQLSLLSRNLMEHLSSLSMDELLYIVGAWKEINGTRTWILSRIESVVTKPRLILAIMWMSRGVIEYDPYYGFGATKITPGISFVWNRDRKTLEPIVFFRILFYLLSTLLSVGPNNVFFIKDITMLNYMAPFIIQHREVELSGLLNKSEISGFNVSGAINRDFPSALNTIFQGYLMTLEDLYEILGLMYPKSIEAWANSETSLNTFEIPYGKIMNMTKEVINRALNINFLHHVKNFFQVFGRYQGIPPLDGKYWFRYNREHRYPYLSSFLDPNVIPYDIDSEDHINVSLIVGLYTDYELLDYIRRFYTEKEIESFLRAYIPSTGKFLMYSLIRDTAEKLLKNQIQKLRSEPQYLITIGDPLLDAIKEEGDKSRTRKPS